MHVCVLGTGAAGWLSAHFAKNLPNVDQVTIIGSPAIPTIGVGESTTLRFQWLIEHVVTGEDVPKFLAEIDAAVKYGVYYQRWSSQDFLHAFTGDIDQNQASYIVGALPAEQDPGPYISVGRQEILDHKFIPLGFREELGDSVYDSRHANFAWHFDANKLISALQCRGAQDPRIRHINGTVLSSRMEDGRIQSIRLLDGTEIVADYFMSCIGQTAFNQRIFGETYVSYSDILLTDRAVYCPLPYRDKSREFHPYTVARTMPHGWRWITPTWSRIGTGYVFSSRHITVEQAKRELARDIGDDSLEFFEADFAPRRIREPFGKNFCFNGMAGGFLEPLDAPGLSLTIGLLDRFKNYVWAYPDNAEVRAHANYCHIAEFDFWCGFILHQYRTSSRRDTDFWRDHSSVQWPYYDGLIDNMFDPRVSEDGKLDFNKNHQYPVLQPWMFFHTSAGKGLRWPVKIDQTPKIVDMSFGGQDLPSHYDFIRKIHEQHGPRSWSVRYD